jgi:TatD DNase family protein
VAGWTDAHCHLQDSFLNDPDRGTDDLVTTLDRAHEAGIDRVVVIGTDFASSKAALDVANTNHAVEIYATVGLHPHDSLSDVQEIVSLARAGHEKLVGIGECGLDYFYEHSPRAEQLKSFATQIALATELDLALVIHARDAFDDLFDVFRSEGVPPRTVIHCFTGGPADVEGCLSFGCDISISGVVTFKNAEELRTASKLVPLDRLHVETDSPFLAPIPFRGKPNEPGWVKVVGEYVAELRGESVDTVRSATAANTARLFGLPVIA